MIDSSVEVRAGDSYVRASISFTMCETYGFEPKSAKPTGSAQSIVTAHSSYTHKAILDTVSLQQVGSMQANLV